MGMAQQTVRFLHPTSLGKTDAFSVRKPAAPRYDVIALRVEFQPDTTRFTTGDGTFSPALFGGLTPNIDPFPHDAGYFQAHLNYLEQYVENVSNGQTQVQTHLIPEVVRVSQTMGAYSPTGPDATSDVETTKLAALVEEAWTQADRETSLDVGSFDPEQTVFMLFHAGAGRDIELVGTTLDKTPEDLPSLFFGTETLGRLGVEGVTFKGLPVTHTAILPETESRLGFDFINDEPFLIELSINGLIAASFFNFLQAPDLFDTTTGTSAIGLFGLMDPLGIFAFNGLFSPEPSAWTKYYLGWTEPEVLTGADPITTSLSAGTETALVPISEGEFFLIENRNRDRAGDGLVVQVYKDGDITEQRVPADAEDFTNLNQSGFIGGVVVRVDDYDWALPGGFDSEGVLRNGGILIWHIDERQIQKGLPGNTVNADPFHRAVDLEEADGGQDLGFPNPNPFGPSLDRGTPFDFFYQDNPVSAITSTGEVRLYQNRFGPDTEPNSNTNAAGPSFIGLDEFSTVGTEMTFRYQRGVGEDVQPVLDGIALVGQFTETSGIGYYPNALLSGDVLVTGNTQSDRTTLILEADPPLPSVDPGYYTGKAPRASAPEERANEHMILIRREPGEYAYSLLNNGQGVGLFDLDAVMEFEVVETQEALLEEGIPVYYAGFNSPVASTIVRISREANPVYSTFEGGRILTLAAYSNEQLVVVGSNRTEVRDGDQLVQQWVYTIPEDTRMGQVVFGVDEGGRFGVMPVVSENDMLLLENNGKVTRFSTGSGEQSLYPVLVDVDGNGYLEILTTVDDQLMAYSRSGAIAPGFPIELTAPAVAQPLVARFAGQTGWSIIIASTDGNVYAYNLDDGGRQVEGFPLAAGGSLRTTPVLHDQTLYTVSETGSVRGWLLEHLEVIWWGELYGNAQNQSYVELLPDIPAPESAVLLVTSETYNWPNPITSGETNLRFMVTENARIEVTIADLAGTVVDELVVETIQPNVPEEIRWQTDAESGVYFGRIKAISTSGKTETHLIKMAIIR